MYLYLFKKFILTIEVTVQIIQKFTDFSIMLHTRYSVCKNTEDSVYMNKERNNASLRSSLSPRKCNLSSKQFLI